MTAVCARCAQRLFESFVRVDAKTADLPDVQRTTLRSMQYGMSEMSVWERISLY